MIPKSGNRFLDKIMREKALLRGRESRCGRGNPASLVAALTLAARLAATVPGFAHAK
jgi:hypothetical protein